MLILFLVTGLVLLVANSSLLNESEEKIIYVEDSENSTPEQPKDIPKPEEQPRQDTQESKRDAESIIDELYNS